MIDYRKIRIKMWCKPCAAKILRSKRKDAVDWEHTVIMGVEEMYCRSDVLHPVSEETMPGEDQMQFRRAAFRWFR